MNRCPLPVDWLDALEGRSADDARAHLEECPSCRAVVGSLTPLVGVDLSPPDLSGVGNSLGTFELFEPGGEIGRGELWLTRPAGAEQDRLPILVLDTFEESGERWADVAPLSLEEEYATDGDLLLREDDTSPPQNWRVVLRRTQVVLLRDLAQHFGALSEAGCRLLDAALAGQVPAARTGVRLESETDYRLRVDEWMTEPLSDLAGAYAGLLEIEAPTRTLKEVSAAPSRPSESRTVLPFRLVVVDRPSHSQDDYRLAAASGLKPRKVRRAQLGDPESKHWVDTHLWLDAESDELRLTVEQARGLSGVVTLLVDARGLGKQWTVRTELTAGRSIVLASGAALGPADISAIELVLHDAS